MSNARTDAGIPYPVSGGHQAVAFTVASAATANAVSGQTRRVVLTATADCHVAFGAAPTATTADFFLPSGLPVMLSIRAGEKVAAIRSSADGTLHVSEVTY